jgi:hypothetical protein
MLQRYMPVLHTLLLCAAAATAAAAAAAILVSVVQQACPTAIVCTDIPSGSLRGQGTTWGKLQAGPLKHFDKVNLLY